jgi:hypothetical protein
MDIGLRSDEVIAPPRTGENRRVTFTNPRNHIPGDYSNVIARFDESIGFFHNAWV